MSSEIDELVVQLHEGLAVHDISDKDLDSDLAVEIERTVALETDELTALQRHRRAVARYVKLHHETVPEFEDATMLPGHVHNLTAVEMIKLQLLWVLMLRALACEPDEGAFEKRPAKQKLAYCRQLFVRLHPLLPSDNIDREGNWQAVQSDALELSNFVLDWERLLADYFAVESVEELTRKMDSNPLAMGLYFQLGAEDPDTLLLRFLRARKWRLLDATVMLLDTLYWHRSFGVTRLMMGGEPAVFEYLLTCGKHYAWNVDHKGRLLIWITSRLHDKNCQTLHQNLEGLVFLIEQARRLMAPGTETVSLVFDLADAPLSSLDLPSIQGDIHVLQNYYPECLGSCYIVDAPWIFHGVYRIVRTFLDPVVVGKVNLIKSSEIVRFVHPSMVPKRYAGGCDPIVFAHSIDRTGGDKRIDPQANEEMRTRLQTRVRRLCSQLIRMTLMERAVQAFQPDGRRASIRADLTEAALQLENASLPPSHYHRCMVLSSEGQIDWTSAREL